MILATATGKGENHGNTKNSRNEKIGGSTPVGAIRIGNVREFLAGARDGRETRRGLYLPGPEGGGVFDGQKRLDAGAVRVGVRLLVPHVWHARGVA